MSQKAKIGSSSFEEYQKEEYGHIAEAHFKTIESISSFFRYYLLITAVPLSVVAALAPRWKEFQSSGSIGVSGWALAGQPLALVFSLVGLLGFLMLWYVLNLRFDALLYARQVNLIRKYFYDGCRDQHIFRHRFRALPVDGNSPHYRELYFLPVVATFALVNSAYGCFSLALWRISTSAATELEQIASEVLTTWPWFVGGFFFHIACYLLLAGHREHGYLRRARTILVDIDGVLNEHRDHFCTIFEKRHGRRILPSEINALPVHRSPNLGVTKAEERVVFCDASYWTEMPVLPGSAEHLREIRSLGLRVQLVTRRPWPYHGLERNEVTNRLESWRSEISMWLQALPYNPWRERIRLHLRTMRPIEIVTIAWLRHRGIPFDRLTVECTGGPIFQKVVAGRNRFEMARAVHPLFCVEDDPVNAAKMSFYCETVFLLDHPYNTSPLDADLIGEPGFTEKLPGNVIRVKDWNAIYQLVRRMA